MAPIWNDGGGDGFDSGDPIGGFPFLPIRKPILPRSPVKPPPATTNPPGQGLPAQVRAVLHSVAPNDKTPTTCSVLLENRMPPRNGVTLPAGFGPVYKAGTVNAPGPFYNDPQTLEGGSWVLVDTKNNVVINVLQGVSQSIPSSSAWFTQTHVHTGAQDAFGNPMPGQVDLTSHTQGNLPGSKLYPLPGGFAFTATAANQAYSATSGGAYTCKFDLTVTATANAGTPSQYLDRIEVYTAPTGTTHYSLNTIIKTNAFGAFTGVAISGLGSGVAYDVYVHVVAKQPGSYLVSGSLFTTSAQMMGTGSFASGPGTAPTITAASFTARTIGKGIIQRIAVSITESDFTTPVPSWANSLIIGLRENGSGATTFTGMHRVVAAKSSTTGTYTATLFAGAGDIVDVGVCYVDAQGNQSAITWPASLTNIGDPNGDFFDSGNSYRTVLHTRHSPGVTGVIDSAGTLDVSKARTSTILPRANTHSSITGAIDTASRIIGSIFDGTNARTPSDVTGTVLSGGGIDFSSSKHTNKNQDNIADGTTYARVKSTELATGTVKQLNDGTNLVGAAIAAAVTTGTLQKNLVLNGNNTNGTGSLLPASYGWKGSWSGGTVNGSSTSLYTVNGQSYHALRVTGSGTNPGVYQDIPVVPGQTYTYCVLAFGDTGVQPKIFIGNAGFTTQYNAVITAPLGNMGAYYTASGVTLTLSQAGAAGTSWTVLYGTFTIPNGTNTARVLLQGIGATASLAADFSGVQIIQGNRLQDYIDHEPNQSYLASSSVMNQQGSLLNIRGNPGWTYTAPSSTSTTLNIASATFTLTDGSTITPAAFSQTFTGLVNGGTYYVDISLDVQNVRYLVNGKPQGSAALSGSGVQRTSTQQFTDCYVDGVGPLEVNASFQQLSSGSGTGGSGSGSGGSGSCPALWQRVNTRERGLVRADEVNLYEHLPTLDGGWCKVVGLQKKPAPIWRYTLSDERGYRESFDVNDTHAVMLEGKGWTAVRDLHQGDLLVGKNGSLTVQSAVYLRDDFYIAIEVEGHEYLLGECLMHNPTTF